MLTEFTLARKNVTAYVEACRELDGVKENRTLSNTLASLCAELEDYTLNVAVVGDIKRGKSTLINTLLGRADDMLSPVGVTICTSAIVKYRNYKADMPHEPHAMVYYENSPEAGYRVGYEDLRGLISQKLNPDNSKGVRCIEVYGDFPLLGNCCLVDTPGTNAVIDRHADMVSEFLPSADAIIMPIMSGQAMTDSEQRLLRSLSPKAKRRIFYVLTKVDMVSATELPTVLDWVRTCIREAGLEAPTTIYQVACRKVFDARKAGADEQTLRDLRAKFGISRLEEDLGHFMLSQSDEGRMLAQRLINTVEMVRGFLSQRQKANAGIIEAHDVTAEDIEKECARVRAEFEEFQRDLKRRLARFSSRWDRETERGLDDLEGSAEKIVDEVKDLLAHSSFTKLFNLGSAISSKVRPHVLHAVDRLEGRLTPLIDALQQDFEEGAQLYARRVQSGTIGGAASALAVLGASTLTAVSCTAPALSGLVTAINAYIAAAGAASTPSIWTAIGTWLGVSTVKSAAATAGAAVMSAVASAIIPLVIAALALYLTGPLARIIVGAKLPGNVEKILGSIRANLHRQLERWKASIIERCEEMLDQQRQDMESLLEQQRRRLQKLDPAAKAAAEDENRRIALLLGQHEQVFRCVNALPCGK